MDRWLASHFQGVNIEKLPATKPKNMSQFIYERLKDQNFLIKWKKKHKCHHHHKEENEEGK